MPNHVVFLGVFHGHVPVVVTSLAARGRIRALSDRVVRQVQPLQPHQLFRQSLQHFLDSIPVEIQLFQNRASVRQRGGKGRQSVRREAECRQAMIVPAGHPLREGCQFVPAQVELLQTFHPAQSSPDAGQLVPVESEHPRRLPIPDSDPVLQLPLQFVARHSHDPQLVHLQQRRWYVGSEAAVVAPQLQQFGKLGVEGAREGIVRQVGIASNIQAGELGKERCRAVARQLDPRQALQAAVVQRQLDQIVQRRTVLGLQQHGDAAGGEEFGRTSGEPHLLHDAILAIVGIGGVVGGRIVGGGRGGCGAGGGVGEDLGDLAEVLLDEHDDGSEQYDMMIDNEVSFSLPTTAKQ
mmetsp:Transcript_26522/g.56426  ORF Transcript_26522/g.56426 Transcript_26522/m.56426 type:complete len:351 (-) Transcript_26522:29-1081(-)